VPAEAHERAQVAFLFDLDGTLVDSVYQHVLAWQEALQGAGIELATWRIHRRVGMSGGLFVRALAREIGRPVEAEESERLQQLHREGYLRRIGQVRPLPGAIDLLDLLSSLSVPWAIATSGRREGSQQTIGLLEQEEPVVVVTRDDVQRAKPDPDLFLTAAARLGVPIVQCVVVGDSIWDLLAARRSGALGVGFLSGGYGEDELARAGAYRVYEDPADLKRHLDELGVRELG
jgi:HAD superfamily hydrolase (TIGR01509 family)